MRGGIPGPPPGSKPGLAFEYRWAVTLLDEVLNRLELDYQRRKQAALFAALKPTLVGEKSDQPYAVLAAQLGMEKAAIRVAVHRLRARYRELLRAEFGETLASPEEVDAEMRYLFEVLARGR